MPHKSHRKFKKVNKQQLINRPLVADRVPQTVASENVAIPKPAYQPRTIPKSPIAAAPDAAAALAATRHPWISAELKRIGTIAGIIIVILIVLSFFLRG